MDFMYFDSHPKLYDNRILLIKERKLPNLNKRFALLVYIICFENPEFILSIFLL